MGRYVFGVDLGGTTVKLGLFRADGEVLDKWEIPTRTENNGEKILPDIAESILEKAAQKNLDKADIIGVGIGVPGPVDGNGVVYKAVNLGWGVFNISETLSQLCGLPAYAGNDANVAALGEVWQGGGKGYKNIIMITLGTGVGGGVILGGKILTGSKGAAGEIGHITVNYDEEDTCGCGKRGCLEQFASATGIVKEAKRLLITSDKPSKLRDLQYLSAKAIFDCAKEGDELANDLVEQLGKYLGLAASHIAAVVDPDAFVIGGGVSKAGEMLTTLIKKYYEQNVMFALQNKEFRLAELGNDAGIYGCAKMVLE